MERVTKALVAVPVVDATHENNQRSIVLKDSLTDFHQVAIVLRYFQPQKMPSNFRKPFGP